MQRYFFHVQDGQYYPDLEGMELPGLPEARLESVKRSAELLRDNGPNFWDGQVWKMIVEDDQALVMFQLQFAAVQAPATQQYGSRISAMPPL